MIILQIVAALFLFTLARGILVALFEGYLGKGFLITMGVVGAIASTLFLL